MFEYTILKHMISSIDRDGKIGCVVFLHTDETEAAHRRKKQKAKRKKSRTIFVCRGCLWQHEQEDSTFGSGRHPGPRQATGEEAACTISGDGLAGTDAGMQRHLRPRWYVPERAGHVQTERLQRAGAPAGSAVRRAVQ